MLQNKLVRGQTTEHYADMCHICGHVPEIVGHVVAQLHEEEEKEHHFAEACKLSILTVPESPGSIYQHQDRQNDHQQAAFIPGLQQLVVCMLPGPDT